MIYSPRKQLVFVHIQRTGGTSLATLLKQSLPDAQEIGGEHSTAAVALSTLGRKTFFRCFRFAFVRNPWDRMVSWFSRGKVGGTTIARRFDIHQGTSFEEFLANMHPRLFVPQLDYLRNARGRMLVDHVYRFENYLESVQHLCTQFGVDPKKLLHRMASRHEHYSTYYTPASKAIVAERFAADIAYFGYKFGE